MGLLWTEKMTKEPKNIGGTTAVDAWTRRDRSIIAAALRGDRNGKRHRPREAPLALL